MTSNNKQLNKVKNINIFGRIIDMVYGAINQYVEGFKSDWRAGKRFVPILSVFIICLVSFSFIIGVVNGIFRLWNYFHQLAVAPTTTQQISSSTINAPINPNSSPSNNLGSGAINNGAMAAGVGAKAIVNVDNSILSPYSEVAKMNYLGLPYNYQSGGGIKISNSISKTIENYLTLDDNSKIIITCSSSSMEAFNDVIKEIPKYPYTYYYLGWCQGQQASPFSSPLWPETMKKAYDIVKITTQIPEHDPTQNTLYNYLKDILNEK